MGNNTHADEEMPRETDERTGRLIRKAMRSLGWLVPMTEEAVRLSDEESQADARGEHDAWPTLLREAPEPSTAPRPVTAAPNTLTPDPSFAFMPFKSSCGESTTQVFLDPAERVATGFGAAGVGVVRPFSTSRMFTALDDVSKAGQWMNVDYVFDGRIDCSGSRVRATARLVRVSDGRPVWKTNWAGERGDLIAFENSLAEQVVLVFRPHSTPEQRARFVRPLTDNADAYFEYKLGRDRFNSFDEDGLGDAIGYFKRAFDLDPNFADAYACAGETLIWLILLGLHTAERGPADLLEEARRYTEQALALNPALPNALTCEAFINMFFKSDWAAAARGFRRALEEDSNYVLAYVGLACGLMGQRSFAQALAHVEAALNIDPNSFICHFLKGTILYESRDFGRAARQFEDTLLLHKRLVEQFRSISESLPPPDMIFYGLALAYAALSRDKDAALAAKRATRYTRNNPIKLALRAYVLAVAGRREDAQAILAQLLQGRQEDFIPFHIALIHAALSDKDAALRHLLLGQEKRDYWMYLLHVDPRLDNLRSDPGFEALLRQTVPPVSETP
jgi:TolB-like protein/tetratricopeptide (TPR) repeat protein